MIGDLEDRIVVLTSKKHPKPTQIKKAPSGRRDKRGDIVISMSEKESVAGLIITRMNVVLASAASAPNGKSEPPTVEPAATALRANGHSKS
jgi:hypothetical protein